MTYPKPVMSKPELMQMGFPRTLMDRAFRERGQKMAWRINPKNNRSTILFDTEEFEKWRIGQSKLLNMEVPDEKRGRA